MKDRRKKKKKKKEESVTEKLENYVFRFIV